MSRINYYCGYCGSELLGKYCHVCGVHTPQSPLTMRGILADFWERVVQIESSVVRTAIHLLFKPKTVVDSFIAGIRRRYTHPFTFLLLVSTVSVLLANLIGDEFWNQYRATMIRYAANDLAPAQQKTFADFYAFLLSMLPYWMLFFTLPLAFILKIFFPRRQTTTAEFWVVCLYAVSVAIIIDLFWSVFCYFAKIQFSTQSAITNLLIVSAEVLLISTFVGRGLWNIFRVVFSCLVTYALVGSVQNLLAVAYVKLRLWI